MNRELKEAVIRQLNCEMDEINSIMLDVAGHGADTGWPGFTYYNECELFVRANRKLIIEELLETADMLGTTSAVLMSSFKCLKDSGIGPSDIDAFLLCGRHECDGMLWSALAWFALERVAQDWVDNMEEG